MKGSTQFSQIVVCLSLFHLIVLTYLSLFIQARYGIEISSAVIVSNFTTFGGELIGLLGYKAFKIRQARKEREVTTDV